MTDAAATASAQRGRPRSERARQAILWAAGDLMLSEGMKATTMEAIAARAHVSKATIYKWWPSRNAVALEGVLARVQEDLHVPAAADLRLALRHHVAALIHSFIDTEAGALIRALAAQSIEDPQLAAALREHWLGPRRVIVSRLVQDAVERGELRADLEVSVAMDQLFAPIYYRLIFGHAPLEASIAGRLVDQLLDGIRPAPTS